jgi:uncharacterized protein with PIN domain
MLQRLGRWLRAAGYDVYIAGAGEADKALLQRTREEGRWLLTRDRKLAERRDAVGYVCLLDHNALEGAIAEVSRLFAIDWQMRPFSRCLECNTPVVPASDAQYAQLPEGALSVSDKAWYCPHCRKLYWDGSHVRRMRRTLENFARGQWEIAGD